MAVVVQVQADSVLPGAPVHDFHALRGGKCLYAPLFQNGLRQAGGRPFVQAAAQVVHAPRALPPPGDGGTVLIEGIAVAVQNLRILDGQHVPENSAPALPSGKVPLAKQGKRLRLLEALRLLHGDAGQLPEAHRRSLPDGQVVVLVLDGGAVGQHQRAAALRKGPHPGLKRRLDQQQLGQDHHLVAAKVRLRWNDVHRDVPVIEELIQLLHLLVAVQQDALALDAERRQGIVIVDNGHLAPCRGGHRLFILPDVREEALHLRKLPPPAVVRVQDAIAELLRSFRRAPETEIQHRLAAVGHGLIGPELRLPGPGKVAGDVVALSAHDGLGNPEIAPLQPPDVVQFKGDRMGRQRRLLPAPNRVVVVRRDVQGAGGGGVIHVLVQPAAGKVVDHHGTGGGLFDQAHLKGQKIPDALAAKPLPVQPEGRVMGGDGLLRQGDLLKAIVLLGPEGGPVGLVQRLNVPPELLLQVLPESAAAPGAPAQIAALVAQLVIRLPGNDRLLVPVVLHHPPDDFLRILIQRGAVVAAHMPPAEGPPPAPLELREDVRPLPRQPRRYGGGGRAQDDLQAPPLRLGDGAVEKREVIRPLALLHPVPGKLRNPNYIAPQVYNGIQILLHPPRVPLLRVIIHSQPHHVPLLSSSRFSTVRMKNPPRRHGPENPISSR